MNTKKKAAKYSRLYKQLKDLFKEEYTPVARMATIVTLLHHKMDGFFWTGFYLLEKGELLVGPYQGTLACIKLRKDTGVCWAGISTGKTVVVPDVHKFPGHIACDDRSNSEIVVPLHDTTRSIVGILDVDSREFDFFDEADAFGLEKIVGLIYEH